MSTFAINPIQNPGAWDYLVISGVQSPLLKDGKLEAKREYKWDVKEGKGAKGATETFVGVPPVKFSATFVLFTVGDFAAWDNLKYILTYDPTKTTTTTPAAPATGKAGAPAGSTSGDDTAPAASTTSSTVPANANGAPAFDVYHPTLADLGISSVVTVSIGGVVYVGDGEYNATVELMEFTVPPQSSAVATPTSATPTQATTGAPSALVPAQAAAAAQQGQAAAAAAAQYTGTP